MTILFEDGVELTQTRRINKASSFDFVKLERLNALSRRICTEPVSAAEFRAELKKIDREKPKVQTLYLGSVVTALSFMQRQVQPVFRNAAFFQVLVGFVSGSFIWFVWRQVPALDVDKISIGVIMLLIPGAALTNAVRDMLVGHTVSGLLRMFESLLLALMLAIGFGSAIYLFGV